MGAFRDVIKRDGVLGFLMRRFDFPIAPVLGLILGPTTESQLRRAFAISLGGPLVPDVGDAARHCADRVAGAVRAAGDEPVQGERGSGRGLI
jgi:hypothetical protein